jgi:hypothetical protein
MPKYPENSSVRNVLFIYTRLTERSTCRRDDLSFPRRALLVTTSCQLKTDGKGAPECALAMTVFLVDGNGYG